MRLPVPKGEISGGVHAKQSFVIEAHALSLGYGGRAVLDDVEVGLPSGDGPLALAGPNGSGKSTFLRACLALVAPQRGSLRVLGTDVGTAAFRRMLRSVGWAPQHRSRGGIELSVREFVELGRRAGRKPFSPFTSEDRAAAENAMRLCGIYGLSRRFMGELSGGQYQRASIARALAAEPRLLLLDEPTTHLDAEGRRSVADLIGVIAGKSRATLVLVSHDPSLLSLCNRFWAFSNGAVRESRIEDLDFVDA